MQAVTNYKKKYDENIKIVLPRIQYIIGTEAMNCGVSSDFLKHCKLVGLPPNLYVLLYTIRRVDHHLNATPGSNTHKMNL